MIETKIIAVKKQQRQHHREGTHRKVSAAQEAKAAMRYQRGLERREAREHHNFTYAGGVTRCSKCPPKRSSAEPDKFCSECASINRARQHAGLIRPRGDPRPSTDNIINPTVVGKYRGPSFQRRYSTAPQPIVGAFVEPLGRGWRRGVATLNGKRIYVGKPMRSVSDAWAYATQSQRLIKLGLEFESDCADIGVL